MARFDCAEWKPITGNTGGPISPNIGLVLHHAVANGSLYDTFEHGDVSAHFWVAYDGTIEQYVDSETVAWHAGSAVGNGQYCGVETEGCADAPYADPMTDPMVDALAALYAEGHRRHGWPFTPADTAGRPGFAYHRLFSATACPCQIRVDLRLEILTLAGELADTPTPPTLLEGENVTSYYVDNTHHVYAQRDDGTVDHWWLDTATRPPVWNHETLPKP